MKAWITPPGPGAWILGGQRRLAGPDGRWLETEAAVIEAAAATPGFTVAVEPEKERRHGEGAQEQSRRGGPARVGEDVHEEPGGRAARERVPAQQEQQDHRPRQPAEREAVPEPPAVRRRARGRQASGARPPTSRRGRRAK